VYVGPEEDPKEDPKEEPFESPLDMIQRVIAEWREGQYDTNLEALLAVDAIMNSGDTTKDETAWAKSVMRDLKINEVPQD
jgi:hypothetical protein